MMASRNHTPVEIELTISSCIIGAMSAPRTWRGSKNYHHSCRSKHLSYIHPPPVGTTLSCRSALALSRTYILIIVNIQQRHTDQTCDLSLVAASIFGTSPFSESPSSRASAMAPQASRRDEMMKCLKFAVEDVENARSNWADSCAAYNRVFGTHFKLDVFIGLALNAARHLALKRHKDVRIMEVQVDQREENLPVVEIK